MAKERVTDRVVFQYVESMHKGMSEPVVALSTYVPIPVQTSH